MKVEVKQLFRDKITKQLYDIGMVVEFNDEQRVSDMVERGLAEVVNEIVSENEQPASKKSKATK